MFDYPHTKKYELVFMLDMPLVLSLRTTENSLARSSPFAPLGICTL